MMVLAPALRRRRISLPRIQIPGSRATKRKLKKGLLVKKTKMKTER